MTRVRLSDDEFTTLTGLLYRAAGLAFDDSRRESLAFSVHERMRAAGCTDVASYLALVGGAGGAAERQALLDEVTIPETHFFRNPPQIRALRKYVLPELLKQAGSSRRLRIWSAGCSTGEEPYTIAMLLHELLPASAGWDIKVIASDVSTRALAAARRGRYADRAFVMTDPVDLQRFFVLDANAGCYEVREEIKRLVEFRHHNLITEPPPVAPGELDLLLCRNVTIYFDRDTTRALMQRFHTSLRDGGYLFLGHAETLWQITDAFALVPLGDAFVYRRPGPSGERRTVLPDRRTEDEPRPTKADRRRTVEDRRKAPLSAPRVVHPPVAPPRPPVPAPVALDPLLAVRAAAEAGRYDEAADLAAEVTTADPLRQQAHYLHGLALTNLGRDADALVVLRKAVYLGPQDGFAHFLLAGALERLDEPVAAIRSYRAAASTLGASPRDAVATELGGRSVAELAEACARQALRLEAITRGSSA